MRLSAALATTLEETSQETLAQGAKDLSDAVILEALSQVGHETVRRRTLPPEVVVWLVIGMALFRDRCIAAVASHLWNAIGRTDARSASASGPAIVQARDRLGAQPMEAVFAYTADVWALDSADKDRWRGLALFGVDGTTMRVADTPENSAHFGRPSSGGHRGPSGYPQARVVALMALRSHTLLGGAIGAYSEGETTLAARLWHHIPDDSLTIVDRGFINYATFFHIVRGGLNRHFLTRAKKNLRWTVIEDLGPGDHIVEVPISHAARRREPHLSDVMVMRAIRYQRKGFQPQWLLTSLLDPDIFPADEIRGMYHERWELELGFDEIKTHTLDREECLRSKSPERVKQEIWGVLVAYNLVRRQMERFADEHNLPPRRISYRGALIIVRNTCLCATAGVGSVRKLIDSMNADMRLIVLPERRERSYPRVTKIKMSNYPRNLGKS